MDKQILNFTVNEQILVCENPIKISTNKVNYIQASFDLGENWDGFDSVRAVWFNDFYCISTVLDSQGVCFVPSEVMKRNGKVKVNLVGSISENDVLTDRLTSYPIVAVIVDCTAQINGAETAPITPSQFEQYVAIVRGLVDSVKDIDHIELNSDYTLTIYYSDGTSDTTGPVRGADGNGIESVTKTGTSGLVDTYTITYTDGQTTTFAVTNGAKGDTGNGIQSIAKTSTVGLVDTYTITYTNGTTTTFTVTNGEKGDKGEQGEAGGGAVGTVASAYSASKTYAVGDYVIHNSNLYRCTTAITAAEAFNSAHWTQVVLGDDVTDLKSDLNNVEATMANTAFLKDGNNIIFGNLSYGNLYVSSADTKASFTLASNVAIPANTTIHFKASNIETDIPTYSAHNWYLAIYNSGGTNVQNIVQGNDIDEFDFVSTSTAAKVTILLQITYSISESKRCYAKAYNLEMWYGKYVLNSDLVDVDTPSQNKLLPNLVGNANTNQYNGKVLVCGDTTGRNYFSSASTSVTCQMFEATGLTAGDKLHFTYSRLSLDITPTTMSYGTIFMAKFNSGGTNLGYAYFTPDGYYTVEENVVKVIAYMPITYSIGTSAWGVLTTHDALVTVGDIFVNEDLSSISSVQTIKRERVKPNETYSAGGSIKRCYNPYKTVGSHVLTGQLHCHSKFKQGGSYVYYAGSDEGLMQLMADCGYDFATITDYFHNGEITEKPANTHGLIWLCNGQETAPSANSGLTAQHMCVYNCTQVYNFPSNSQPEYIANVVTADGCACDLAHPSWSDLYQSPEKIALIRDKIRFCEIYDGLNDIDNDTTFPTGKSWDYAWEIMLDNGCVTWGTAVNDSHTGSDADGGITKGCVKVFAEEETAESIWEALCKGNFVASTRVSAMIDSISFTDGVLSIDTGDAGASVVFKKEEGTVVKSTSGQNVSYTMDGTEKYVRAVVTLSSGEIIWTQPIINVSYYDIDDYGYTY